MCLVEGISADVRGWNVDATGRNGKEGNEKENMRLNQSR